MKKKIFTLLSLALTMTIVAAGELIQVRVKINNLAEAARLADLNLTGDIHLRAGIARFYVTAGDLAKIISMNFSYEIVPKTDFRTRASSSEIYTKINTLVSTYPQLCKKYVFGQTKTDGKELCAIKISDNVAIDENEPEVFFDGGIHGNEYAGPDLTIRFAQYLCSGYASNTQIANLVNNREIWFFCMVNPEGRDRGTRGSATCSDLNRTYGYINSGNFSEAEPRAVRDCMLSNQFTIHLTYHTGIEYLLYPWGFTGTATPEKTIHKKIADLYSTTSGYYNPSDNVQSYADYPTTGETLDYSYGALGNLCLTMEICNSGTLTDAYYNYNQPAMLKMIEYAGYGMDGLITDQATGLPVAGIVYINTYWPCYADPVVGDYHKYLPAGTYSMKVVANGYVTKTISSVTVTDQSLTHVNVQMQKDTANKTYAYKVVYAESGTGNTPNVLGPSDNLTYSGLVVIDMLTPVTDKTGKDIKVYTSGSVTCSAAQSPDGAWKSLGSGTEFDLASAGLTSARYFKLSGAAVDAVEATADTVINSKDDLAASFKGLGIWQRNSDTKAWAQLNVNDATLLACGDFDGNGRADIIGAYAIGLWIRTDAGTWEKVDGVGNPAVLACGDTNGDGKDDLIGVWPGLGVWTRYSKVTTNAWTQLHTKDALLITAGDYDQDGKDDLLGVWDSEGIWIRYATGTWKFFLDKTNFLGLASGDMNGDGRDDILGNWTHGIWWYNLAASQWTRLFDTAAKICPGDLDGNNSDDLIGIWTGVPGIWCRYQTGTWEKLIDVSADALTAGKMR